MGASRGAYDAMSTVGQRRSLKLEPSIPSNLRRQRPSETTPSSYLTDFKLTDAGAVPCRTQSQIVGRHSTPKIYDLVACVRARKSMPKATQSSLYSQRMRGANEETITLRAYPQSTAERGEPTTFF
ncbi:hypothetical protein HI914_00520 [Erysiphe necator]|nr:hypothetical protein HI914_00520 [Erysiphe necator]